LDVIARYGGDEFIALLPETGSQAAGYAGERIRESVENNTLEIEGRKVGVTVSIGIAAFPEHGDEIQEVMSKADQAMYCSKKNGKNRSTTFSVSMTE
jgi:diguanylate cyclase (GGDEF)-like protein